MYILRAQLGALKYNSLQKGNINAALRLGTLLTTETTYLKESTSQVDLGIKLNLNSDNPSQMLRCSITLSLDDGRVLGVASMSLPKINNQISTITKLIQCPDKKAELCLKLRIDEVIQQNEQNLRLTNQLKKAIQSGNLSPIKRRDSVNNTRNNSKTQSSLSKIWPQNFDNTEVKPNLKPKKTLTEEQATKLREQKDIYCQLYKIQKSKNQAAYKFISSLIAKLTNQYPQLLNFFIEPNFSPLKSKVGMNASSQKNQQSDKIKQLEEANRSLHRHLDEYKKANKQLKDQLLKSSNNNTNFDGCEGLSQFVPIPSIYSQRNERLKNPSKSSRLKSPLQGLNLKEVLQDSILQRSKLSQLLKQYLRTQQKQIPVDKSKLKLKIDKAFLVLLSKNVFNRQSILIHKKEINKIIEQSLI